MKNLLLALISLLGFVGPAFGQFTNTSVSNGVYRKPIVLTNRELIGNGIPRSFTIPEKTNPSQDTLRVRLFSRQWTRLGGQNRSGQVHPGFDYSPEAHATAGLHQYFLDDNGGTALPYSWNAHIVLFEWGPTQPASPEEWISAEDWEWACENNPTCYWGAATYNASKDHRDEWREYTLSQTGPYAHWYQAGKTPGATVHYVPVGFWEGGAWDGSHAWPIYVKWEQTTLLWLTWE